LSNFYPSDQIDENGVVYKTNEHYYQAAKTLDDEKRQWILDAPDPATAKRRGNHRSVPLRPDWETVKIPTMMDGLRIKFPKGQHVLTDRLLFTEPNYLVEHSPWGDTFWGVDKDYKGQNWLGRLLNMRRDEILYP
jgi:N-glycosidase YbiA